MQAFIHTKEEDGTGGHNCYLTQEVPVKETPTPRGGQTSNGYGCRMPTPYMVQYHGRWRRVYCICYSNAGTLFIGKEYKSTLTVDIQRS